MSQTQHAFSDTIPGDYDTYLGPFLFEHYAADLARRLWVPAGGSLLETACGTGISTEYLQRELDDGVSIVATDLSEGMLDEARSRRGHLPNVRFEQADAAALPFEDDAFDAVASQFGLMFVPDKLAAIREAHRVLRPGGRLVFSVWDGLASNPFVQVAQDAIATCFDSDPPQFLYVPWSFHDHGALRELLERAGFEQPRLQTVPHLSERPTAREVAIGLVRGNPTINDVRERANATVDDVIEVVAVELAKSFGEAPVRVPVRAIMATAERRAA